VFDIPAYLTSKGHVVKTAGPSDIHTNCCFCSEDPGKRGRLYINIVDQDPPGRFMCFRCGEKGAINVLRRHFGDPPLEGTEGAGKDLSPEGELAVKSYQVHKAAAAYYHSLLADNEEVVRYLHHERGLTDETIEKHQIGWADGTLKIHLREKGFTNEEIMATGLMDRNQRDFLYGHITIPYHASGSVVQIRGKQIDGKYVTPPGQKARLFNVDTLFQAENPLITEGEFDALVLEQQGYDAVGVPGAVSWQDSWTPRFEQAKRVYIVFDNDETGRRGAEKLAITLGGKSRIIKMPEPEPGKPKVDPTEFFVGEQHNKDDFEAILRQSRGGNLLSVDDAVAEWEEVQDAQGLTMGFDLFDALLHPGLLPGQLLVWLAKTGQGKTILMLNMMYRMRRDNPDIRMMFVSLEQTRSEWYERARRIHRFYNPEDNDRQVLDFFRHNMMLTDKNVMTVPELEDAVVQFEDEIGAAPHIIFLDYLGYFARGFRGEGYERTSAATMALKGFAKDHRLVIAAPHQVSRNVKFGEEMEADTGRESGVVEETADFLFGMWNEDARKGIRDDERTGKVTLKILKSRHGGVGSRLQLQFARHSLAMVPRGDNETLFQRAKNELDFKFDLDPSGVTAFEQAIYRHSTKDASFPFDPAAYERWAKVINPSGVMPPPAEDGSPLITLIEEPHV